MNIPSAVNMIAWVFTYASAVVELLGIAVFMIAVIRDRCKTMLEPAADFFKAGGRIRTAVVFMLAFLLLTASRNVRISGRSVLVAVSLICQRYAYLSAYLLGLSFLVEIVIAAKKIKDQDVKRKCRAMELTTGLSMIIGYVVGYFLYIPY